jgi:hypothetical protein
VVYNLPKDYQSSSDKVPSLISRLLSTLQVPTKLPKVNKGPIRSHQVNYTLARPVIQGEYDKVLQTVNFVNQVTSNATANYGIVVDSELASTLLTGQVRIYVHD